ncbi:hypothetical protein AB6A40_006004 [Gnathostoma spinigerum]|uniref:Uncharacterized protein n=1 Tax=Gnathostoma spinigerum TaxID=75299 RepID=A0ABD6EH33_9BILA
MLVGGRKRKAESETEVKGGPVPECRGVVKEGVLEAFRDAFKSGNQIELSRSSRSLRELYASTVLRTESVEYFFTCLRHPMELMCSRLTEKENRLQCLKMVVNFASVMFQNDIHEPLEFIVQFCEEINAMISVSARFFACALARYIFQIQKTGADVSADEKMKSSFAFEPYNLRLYWMILKRRFDTNILVRSEVLKAASVVQTDKILDSCDCSPKKLLFDHLRDNAWECRLIALKALTISSSKDIDIIVQVALGDSNVRVRRAAFGRLARDVHYKSLYVAQRMEILQSILGSRDHSIKISALEEVLGEWLRAAGSDDNVQSDKNIKMECNYLLAPFMLIRVLEPFHEEETSHDVVIASLRYCRKYLKLDNAPVDEFIKKIIDCGAEFIISARNYKIVLSHSWGALDQANSVFFWRCLLDYCTAECRSESDITNCRHRLVPTLHTFTGFVTQFVHTLFYDNISYFIF